MLFKFDIFKKNMSLYDFHSLLDLLSHFIPEDSQPPKALLEHIFMTADSLYPTLTFSDKEKLLIIYMMFNPFDELTISKTVSRRFKLILGKLVPDVFMNEKFAPLPVKVMNEMGEVVQVMKYESLTLENMAKIVPVNRCLSRYIPNRFLSRSTPSCSGLPLRCLPVPSPTRER